MTVVDRAAIRREIVHLAWPVVVQSLLRTTMFLVDTYMLGLLSGQALAAVALAGPVAHTLTMVLSALGVGTLATVARATGARDEPLRRKEAATSIAVAAALGVMLLALAVPAFGHYDVLFEVSTGPELAWAASGFVGWIVLASPFVLLSSVSAGALRASGDTRTPLYVAIVTNALNIAGNYVFIFGKLGAPKMGVAGAGLSSAIALTVEGLFLAAWLFTRRSAIRVDLRSLARVDAESMRRLSKVSLPAAVEPVLLQLGFITFIGMMGQLGTNALAAHRVAVAIESISFMPGWGLAIACGALVGQYLGAQRQDRAEACLRESSLISLWVMVPLGVVFALFAGPLARLFAQSAPEVTDAGAACLRVASVEQIFMALAMVLGGALRGAGDTRSAMIVGVLGVWGIRLPLSYLFAFPLGLGIVGAWIVMIIDWGARAAAFGAVWRRGRWKALRF